MSEETITLAIGDFATALNIYAAIDECDRAFNTAEEFARGYCKSLALKIKKSNDTLHLVLTKKWYDMIDSGEKTEEYREYCPHWDKRIWDRRRELKYVTFQLGYKKDAPRMTFKIRMSGKAERKPEWGYLKRYRYDGCYIIRLGKRVKEGKK